MMIRGLVRGPRNPCKQCNLGYWWLDCVVSMQVVRPERRAGLLIIRRSWVRAPPAPLYLISYKVRYGLTAKGCVDQADPVDVPTDAAAPDE